MSTDGPSNDRRPNAGRPGRPDPGRPAGGRPGRPDRGPRRPPIDPEQAAEDVRRFAQLMKAKQDKERKDQADTRQRAADEKRRLEDAAAEARRVVDAATGKDRAAQRLRDVRVRGNAAEVADAEAGYKAALAEQIAVEQGERPAWAPALPEPDPVAEAEAEAKTDVVIEVDAEPEGVVEPEDVVEAVAEPAAVAEPEPDDGASDAAPVSDGAPTETA